jgi:hypothetical protein
MGGCGGGAKLKHVHRLRQVDVKAEHFERQVAVLERERDDWEKKYEVRPHLYKGQPLASSSSKRVAYRKCGRNTKSRRMNWRRSRGKWKDCNWKCGALGGEINAPGSCTVQILGRRYEIISDC